MYSITVGFYCNMVDAIRTTPQETLFGSLLLLWYLAVVLAGFCHFFCFEFGVLRCPCIPETGRLVVFLAYETITVFYNM